MLMGTAYIQGKRRFIRKSNGWEYSNSELSNDMMVHGNQNNFIKLNGNIQFDVPVPQIKNLRDFYSFESHAKNARKRRGLEMEPEWYKIPAYYYQNATSVIPTGKEIKKPDFTESLDFEAEIAFVIGKNGMNIKKEDAMEYVLGFMLANDWSDRDLQKSEMKIGLGPSKSKDFGTTLGPYITTIDELEDNIEGGRIFFDVDIYINGKRLRHVDTSDMYWTIPDLISYSSMYCNLNLGDVFMTGTLSMGSQVELDSDFLKVGDVVELKSEQLGEIINRVV